MTARIAINGYGRIGRCILRALYEERHRSAMRIVAINDLADPDSNAHLTRHDSTHGRFGARVAVDGDTLLVDDDRIRVLAERNPEQLPWAKLGVDAVLECTGLFCTRSKAQAHLQAGARRVVVSAPAGKDMDATVVYGVNHDMLRSSHTLVSNASCTTNCLAPLAKVLHAAVGIEHGIMNTVHSYTNDQVLTDVFHKDLRRARSATQSMIPTRTGAAAAVGLVLPALDGRLDGFSVRVPTLNVSLVDLTFRASRATTVEEIDAAMQVAANGELQGILAVNDEPLVSTDFNHCPCSSVYDSSMTKVLGGDLVKVCAWYDNEWGFANRMLDTTLALLNAP